MDSKRHGQSDGLKKTAPHNAAQGLKKLAALDQALGSGGQQGARKHVLF